MRNLKDLTTDEYIRWIDAWFQEFQMLPINRWNIFDTAKRWVW